MTLNAKIQIISYDKDLTSNHMCVLLILDMVHQSNRIKQQRSARSKTFAVSPPHSSVIPQM